MSESRFETEKETLERRLKNAIESNEILRSDRDHFKVQCAHREMEEHRLKDEVNALRAEVAKWKEDFKNCSAEFLKLDNEISKLKAELEAKKRQLAMSDDWQKCAIEFSRLENAVVKYKSRAAKYKEALEKRGHEAECFELTKEGYAVRCQCGLEAALSEETES